MPMTRTAFREADFLVFAWPTLCFRDEKSGAALQPGLFVLVVWFPGLWEARGCRGQNLAPPALSLPMWRPTAAPAPDRGGEGGRRGHASPAGLCVCTALRLYILCFNKITVKVHRALQRGRYRALSTERGWRALSGLAEIRWKSSALSGATAPLTMCVRHAFDGMSRNRAAA